MSQPNDLFSNQPIDMSRLPQAERMEMISLEPKYKTIRYIDAGLMGIVMMVASWLLVWFEPRLGLPGLVGASLISALAFWLVYYNGLSYHFMGYAVREKDITYKSGWLWKSMTTIPFNRVQHCDIRQGILDRQFGLARLTIYTAGGQSTDLMIPGLLPETAEKLKTFILRSTEQSIENE